MIGEFVLAIIASSTKSTMLSAKCASIAFDTDAKFIAKAQNHPGRARVRGAETDRRRGSAGWG
jgi:hypothetical protein